MANLVTAINGVGASLDISAVAHDPPDETCTLIDGTGTQVGTMEMTRDWFDYDAQTGEVVVTYDVVGIPGEYWYNTNRATGVWVWGDRNRENAYYVQLLFDFCCKGGFHYAFCVPGGAVQPGKMSCVIADPSQAYGYQLNSQWSLTPHYVDPGSVPTPPEHGDFDWREVDRGTTLPALPTWPPSFEPIGE